MGKRIYVVAVDGTDHLVRATNVRAAINHKAREGITAAVASQDVLVDMLQSGAEIEEAGNDLPAD